jgi:hypothetical protein
VQVVLSIALILGMRALHWPTNVQAAGPAVALMLALGMASILKARLLSGLLGAPVSGWRWPIVWAACAAIVVGWGFTKLPPSLEWIELAFGIPLILGAFGAVIWRRGFTREDRILFRSHEGETPTLPPQDAVRQ